LFLIKTSVSLLRSKC